jgi:beta-galactosidase
MQKGFLITSLCASYSPEFLDLYNDSFIQRVDKPLIVVSSECMAVAIQKRLVKFIRNGGRLLISPVIPQMDENFYPCTILKEFLDDALVERYMSQNMEVNVGPVENVFVNAGLWVSSKHPDGALIIAEEVNSKKVVAWKKNYPNRGMVIWHGLQWKHMRNEHLDMLKYLLGELRCEMPAVHCDNPNIWTSLRSDENTSMLFIMNLFSAPMKANIKVKMKDGSYRDTGCHFLNPMEVKTVKF